STVGFCLQLQCEGRRVTPDGDLACARRSLPSDARGHPAGARHARRTAAGPSARLERTAQVQNTPVNSNHAYTSGNAAQSSRTLWRPDPATAAPWGPPKTPAIPAAI